MKILNGIWRWWKFTCVALVTTFILLFIAATIVNHLKKPDAAGPGAAQCLESGGTWNEDAAECRTLG